MTHFDFFMDMIKSTIPNEADEENFYEIETLSNNQGTVVTLFGETNEEMYFYFDINGELFEYS